MKDLQLKPEYPHASEYTISEQQQPSTSVDGKRFHLLSLPRELRDQCSAYLLVAPEQIFLRGECLDVITQNLGTSSNFILCNGLCAGRATNAHLGNIQTWHEFLENATKPSRTDRTVCMIDPEVFNFAYIFQTRKGLAKRTGLVDVIV